MKKIYFCGSIRGGRDDATIYQEIITHMQEKHIVLTEHIGDLSKSLFENEENRDELIYQQDTSWLNESDIVIAECTQPSLGVGYELAYGEALQKPIHIFYRPKDTSLSAMLKGNPYFHIHPYQTKKELLEEIDAILD